MRIGICDDNETDRKNISDICRKLGYANVYCYASGSAFLNSDAPSNTDVVFLDIDMAEMTGLEVKEIMERENYHTYIIFCTSHNEHMPDAFGKNVISFITKPYEEKSIEYNLKRAASFSRKFAEIYIDGECEICKNILFIKAENGYSVFYCASGRQLLSRNSVKKWGEELKGKGFALISRSMVVNLHHFLMVKNERTLQNDCY